MDSSSRVSRRRFVGGLAAAGYLTLRGDRELWARGLTVPPRTPQELDEYDSYAKLHFNENPYGPPDSVMQAMTKAFKYANRYGYPDGDIHGEIAKHHGVKPDNILLGAGSGEVLNVVGVAFLEGGKKVVGVNPSYSQVYQHATSVRGDAITVPLLPDYRQDIPGLIKATVRNHRHVGFVYICNPNNPTGRVVTRSEITQLLNGIPEDVPVLIDEAYHHFVEDPAYATSISHVVEGRRVIVARTFSKIAALAGMRLGYAVAPPDLIRKMSPYVTGSINALVRWGGVAALKDTASQAQVKRVTLDLRTKTTTELRNLGFAVIPSETNFFMVHLRRPVQPVIEEFRKKGVLVGRPFPPMLEHLRVSVGTAQEMSRFMTAFKEVVPARTAGSSGSI